MLFFDSHHITLSCEFRSHKAGSQLKTVNEEMFVRDRGLILILRGLVGMCEYDIILWTFIMTQIQLCLLYHNIYLIVLVP